MVLPISQIKKWRPKEVNSLPQAHGAPEERCWELNSEGLDQGPILLTHPSEGESRAALVLGHSLALKGRPCCSHISHEQPPRMMAPRTSRF